MHLVLIETSGNQNYIFATNKLRENVGASELTYRLGTQWVLEAVALNQGPKFWPDKPEDEDANELRRQILNPPMRMPDAKIEVIVATSGKAMLLVDNKETGRAIIREVTGRALKDAPGIDVCGVISDEFFWEKESLDKIVRETHKRLDRIRDNRPGAALRFLRLPVVMECATSGLPAAIWDERKEGGEPSAARSVVSVCKRKGSKSYGPRMKKLLRLSQIKGDFADNISVLEKYCDWVAVVHADGNGVGQIFWDFWKYSGCEAMKENGENIEEVNRSYVESYRKFSIALDICTEEAFIFALQNIRKDKLRSLQRIKEDRKDIVPILPILLGGDDLTVVCDGQAALQMTRDFLTTFEWQTARKDLPFALNDIIPQIATASANVASNNLSASAGVAIIKPHFPFSAAYDLAKQLIESAKQMKPHSALDFHALYDASGSDLDRIRERLHLDESKTRLYARPYVVTPLDESGTDLHAWQKLEARIKAIFKKDADGRRCLPNSQLHDLRSGLFLGEKGADARYQLIRERYREQGIAIFDEDGRKSLFFTRNGYRQTHLLDALDAANFWIETGEENENSQIGEDAQ